MRVLDFPCWMGILVFSGCWYGMGFTGIKPELMMAVSAGSGAAVWWQLAFWLAWRTSRFMVMELTDTVAVRLDHLASGDRGIWRVLIWKSVYPRIYLAAYAERGQPVRAWRGIYFRRLDEENVETFMEGIPRKKSMISLLCDGRRSAEGVPRCLQQRGISFYSPIAGDRPERKRLRRKNRETGSLSAAVGGSGSAGAA